MSDQNARERMLELLSDRAVFGLSEDEASELETLALQFPELAAEDSFEMAAAAFSIEALGRIEELPENIRRRIEASAGEFFDTAEAVDAAEVTPDSPPLIVVQKEPGFSWQSWLGWGVAAVACALLAFNILSTRFATTPEIARERTPAPTQAPAETSVEQIRAALASAGDVVTTSWSSPADDGAVEGKIAWSDSKQAGYFSVKGLKENDSSKEQYQLWIFDESQDEATPVDGGVFDIDTSGVAMVPIDAKLKVRNPKMFAVTVEKPGGVVVSKREKIVAIGKV